MTTTTTPNTSNNTTYNNSIQFNSNNTKTAASTVLYFELFFIKVNMLRILFGMSILSSQVKYLKFSIQLGPLNEDKLRNILNRASAQCIMPLCCCILIGKSMSSMRITEERKVICIQEIVLVRNTLQA